MTKLNPNAVIFWMIAAGVGYLVSGTPTGAVVGAVSSMTLSFVLNLISRN